MAVQIVGSLSLQAVGRGNGRGTTGTAFEGARHLVSGTPSSPDSPLRTNMKATNRTNITE